MSARALPSVVSFSSQLEEPPPPGRAVSVSCAVTKKPHLSWTMIIKRFEPSALKVGAGHASDSCKHRLAVFKKTSCTPPWYCDLSSAHRDPGGGGLGSGACPHAVRKQTSTASPPVVSRTLPAVVLSSLVPPSRLAAGNNGGKKEADGN